MLRPNEAIIILKNKTKQTSTTDIEKEAIKMGIQAIENREKKAGQLP